jgi:FkbM family methyltransferase
MGVLMLLDKMDKIDLHLLCWGVWEPDRIDYLKTMVLERKHGERTVFLDIGSHGALYPLVLDKYINFDRIIAFEPEPVSLAQIHANVMMNNLWGKLEIVPKAVSSSSGSAKFLALKNNRGQSRLAETQESQDKNIIDVQVTSIDEIFDEIGTFLVVKIDVEGRENEVIIGMQNTIMNNSIVLQVEKNDGDIPSVEKILTPLGMRRVHSIGQDHYFVKS